MGPPAPIGSGFSVSRRRGRLEWRVKFAPRVLLVVHALLPHSACEHRPRALDDAPVQDVPGLSVQAALRIARPAQAAVPLADTIESLQIFFELHITRTLG